LAKGLLLNLAFSLKSLNHLLKNPKFHLLLIIITQKNGCGSSKDLFSLKARDNESRAKKKDTIVEKSNESNLSNSDFDSDEIE